MSENPYEPPQTPPERKPIRKTTVVVLLALLAVPAAGIAGGVTCASGLAFGPQAGLPLAFAVGFLPMLLILHGVNRWIGSDVKPLFRFHLLGLIIVTPLALLVGGFTVVAGIDLPARPGPPRNEMLYILATGCLAFTVWSAGYWLGLRGGVRRFVEWLKK